MYAASSVSRRIRFFFNDTATTEIYTLALHDALPICTRNAPARCAGMLDVNTTALPVPARGARVTVTNDSGRSEEHTSELQSQSNIVCRLLLEKKNHGQRRTRLVRNYRRTTIFPAR